MNTIVLDKTEKLKRLNALRGLFAVQIILGHAVYQDSVLYPLCQFSIISVAYFFFVSAFGMVLSYHKKNNYLNISFLVRKPIYLLCIAIFIYLFGTAVDIILEPDLGFVSSFFSIKNFFLQTNWYIWELIFFYFMFWFTYKYCYKYRVWIIVLLTTVMVLLFFGGGRLMDGLPAHMASLSAFYMVNMMSA